MTPRRNDQTSGPGLAWSRYEPSAEAPWDLRRVVHLHRRAGFGATRAEVERDLADGPVASVSRVLDGTSRIGGVPEEFESTSTLLADSAVASTDPQRLRACWVYRMLNSPDPLGERLTLMWHGHFPSALSKVEDLAPIRRQNDTFRRLARAPFGELLNEAIREPALLLYLDAPTNKKDQPNENLARELLELFTLGIGNYSEADVKEAARALTGWTVEEGRFRDATAKHDDGEKTILGRSGRQTGAELLGHLADHPATSTRLAGLLCRTFLGEKASRDAPAVDALAGSLRASRLDVGAAVETILRSKAFFDRDDLSDRVIGPAEFVVGACRALLPAGSTPSTLILADWIARIGQELFEPPNVGGWPGGRGWLDPRSLVARSNFATALVEGKTVGLPGPIDAHVDAASLLGVEPRADRKSIAAILASPEAQLS